MKISWTSQGLIVLLACFFLSLFAFVCLVSLLVCLNLSIQVCPKNPGFPLTNPILGMGCFDHQSYDFSGGIWILLV